MNEIRRMLEFMNPLEIIANCSEEQVTSTLISHFFEMTKEEQQEFLMECKESFDSVQKRYEAFKMLVERNQYS